MADVSVAATGPEPATATATATASTAVGTDASTGGESPRLIPLGSTAMHPLFPHDILSISPSYFDGVAKRDESAMAKRAQYWCTAGMKTAEEEEKAAVTELGPRHGRYSAKFVNREGAVVLVTVRVDRTAISAVSGDVQELREVEGPLWVYSFATDACAKLDGNELTLPVTFFTKSPPGWTGNIRLRRPEAHMPWRISIDYAEHSSTAVTSYFHRHIISAQELRYVGPDLRVLSIQTILLANENRHQFVKFGQPDPPTTATNPFSCEVKRCGGTKTIVSLLRQAGIMVQLRAPVALPISRPNQGVGLSELAAIAARELPQGRASDLKILSVFKMKPGKSETVTNAACVVESDTRSSIAVLVPQMGEGGTDIHGNHAVDDMVLCSLMREIGRACNLQLSMAIPFHVCDHIARKAGTADAADHMSFMSWDESKEDWSGFISSFDYSYAPCELYWLRHGPMLEFYPCRGPMLTAMPYWTMSFSQNMREYTRD